MNLRHTKNGAIFYGPPCISVSSVISAKAGINYPDLEPGNEFWNPRGLGTRFLLQITRYAMDFITVVAKMAPCQNGPWEGLKRPISLS